MPEIVTKPNKLIKLEAIRGFAAVYVVIHHTVDKDFWVSGVNLAYLFRFGQEAVILFFILSGIVIHYSFEKSFDKTFRTYFLKRFLRIYIPLILVFITNCFIFSLFNNNYFSVNWENLAGNLLMLQDSIRTKPGVLFSPFLGNLPLWSLSYEWWFYMIFFFVYTVSRKYTGKIACWLSVAGAFTYCIYPNFASRIFMYLIIWWIGADIARLYSRNLKITIRSLLYPVLTLVVCIFFLLVNVILNADKIKMQLNDSGFGISPILELRHFIVAFFFVIAGIFWKNRNWFGFNQTVGLFERIAPISYVFYISHYFLISRARYLDSFIDSAVGRYLIYTLICLVFSYLVERIVYPKISRFVLTRFPGTIRLVTV